MQTGANSVFAALTLENISAPEKTLWVCLVELKTFDWKILSAFSQAHAEKFSWFSCLWLKLIYGSCEQKIFSTAKEY